MFLFSEINNIIRFLKKKKLCVLYELPISDVNHNIERNFDQKNPRNYIYYYRFSDSKSKW